MSKTNIKAKASKPPKPIKVKPAKEKLKKGKKKGQEFDEGLLVGDGDDTGAAEELPDLSDFDETETVESVESEEALLTAASNESRSSDDEIILTDAEGRRLCRVRDCDQAATVEAYCRFHYLLNWKKIQIRRKILIDGKLGRYVEELTSRYPDKFLEMIKKDLRAEKDFHAAIAELEIDESALDNEYEEESQNYIDEVRGVSSESSSISEEEEF